MYQEHVLKHYAEPFQKGRLPIEYAKPFHMDTGSSGGWVHFGEAVSDVCGDKVTLCTVIDEGILDIWWEGDGCCFAMAAASMLVEYAKDKTVQSMRKFTEGNMVELFQADFPSARRDCVFVAWKALQKLLETIA